MSWVADSGFSKIQTTKLSQKQLWECTVFGDLTDMKPVLKGINTLHVFVMCMYQHYTPHISVHIYTTPCENKQQFSKKPPDITLIRPNLGVHSAFFSSPTSMAC